MIKLRIFKNQCAQVIFSSPANEFEILYVEFQNSIMAKIFADMLAASEQFKGEEIKVENK